MGVLCSVKTQMTSKVARKIPDWFDTPTFSWKQSSGSCRKGDKNMKIVKTLSLQGALLSTLALQVLILQLQFTLHSYSTPLGSHPSTNNAPRDTQIIGKGFLGTKLVSRWGVERVLCAGKRNLCVKARIIQANTSCNGRSQS